MKLLVGSALAVLVSACSAPNTYRLAPGELDKLRSPRPVLETVESREVVEVERIRLTTSQRKSIAIDEFFANRQELLPPAEAQVTLLTEDHHTLCITGLGILGFGAGATAYILPTVSTALEMNEAEELSSNGLMWMALWGPMVLAAVTALGFTVGYGLCPDDYDRVTIVTD